MSLVLDSAPSLAQKLKFEPKMYKIKLVYKYEQSVDIGILWIANSDYAYKFFDLTSFFTWKSKIRTQNEEN